MRIPTVWKTRPLQTNIEKLSYYVLKFELTVFLRTTNGVQSRPDALDESWFAMTFLTILGLTETLYSFRLVLEGKAGKAIPESSKLESL